MSRTALLLGATAATAALGRTGAAALTWTKSAAGGRALLHAAAFAIPFSLSAKCSFVAVVPAFSLLQKAACLAFPSAFHLQPQQHQQVFCVVFRGLTTSCTAPAAAGPIPVAASRALGRPPASVTLSSLCLLPRSWLSSSSFSFSSASSPPRLVLAQDVLLPSFLCGYMYTCDSSGEKASSSQALAAAAEATAASLNSSSSISQFYYLALTALLSSAVLLAAEKDRRRKHRPTACVAAAAASPSTAASLEAAALPLLQPLGKITTCTTCNTSPHLVQYREQPCFSTLLAVNRASLISNAWGKASSNSRKGSAGCSRWIANGERRSERRRRSSSSASKVQFKDVKSSGRGSFSTTYIKDIIQSQVSLSAPAAWRRRYVARCAAAEREKLFFPVAAAPFSMAAGGERRSIVTVLAATEPQQEAESISHGSVASSPSLHRQHEKHARLAAANAGAGGPTTSPSFSFSSAQGGEAGSCKGHAREGRSAKEPQTNAAQQQHQQQQTEHDHAHHSPHHDSPLWRSEENRPFEKKLEDALLFCGNGNQPLAAAVADRLSTKLGKVAVKRFADGEVNIQFLDSLRGKDVYLIQPTSTPVNEHLMELLLMISTCRRASAKKITAVIPYYGYARQDRKLSSRVPISAADVARMIEAMGVDRVVAVDLHCGQIQGFFGPRVPVDNLEAQIIGLEYFRHKNLRKPVVVSPDAGGVYRARKFQEGLLARGYSDCGIAMLIKQRLRANEIERMDLVGSVEGSDVIIVDDMIDTAGTLCEAARELRAKGARRVFAFATHGLFSGPAINRIESSPLEEVVVTDSIKARSEVVSCPRITSLSISVLLADAIRRIHQKESLNDLFIVRSWQ